MSGYAAGALGKQANFEEGAHFLQKPFSIEALTTKVREVLNTPQHEPPV
jgi:DNA-binding response OmpR family regulator